MPLAFYSIADGAMLVAVAKDCVQSKDRWVHLTLDQEAFEERMIGTSNPAVRLEAARLRDVRMRRTGDRPSGWTKLRVCVEELEGGRARKKEFTRLPASAAAPSTEPLPVCWAIDSTRKRNCIV
jgi:hypothetical protein